MGRYWSLQQRCGCATVRLIGSAGRGAYIKLVVERWTDGEYTRSEDHYRDYQEGRTAFNELVKELKR